MMTFVGRDFAAQHGHGRILAGVSKEPYRRGGGRIDFFPGTLLGLCMMCCSPEDYKNCMLKAGVRGKKRPSTKAR